MRLAHILVCNACSPERLLSNIDHQEGNFWYIFLHSQDKTVSDEAAEHSRRVRGNLFDYHYDRGLARSLNQGIQLGIEAGCEAFLILTEEAFFYDRGYAAFRNTIEAVRTISRQVALVFVNGWESRDGLAEAVRPQGFACCAIMKEAVERVGVFKEDCYLDFTQEFITRCSTAGMSQHLDRRCLVEHKFIELHHNALDATIVKYREFSSISSTQKTEISKWAQDEIGDSGFVYLTDSQQDALADEHRGVYIYDVTPDHIHIRTKRNSVEGLFGRAVIYKDLIAKAAASLKLAPFSLAMQVEDDAVETNHLPIFAFQKRKGSRNILFPDPDFYDSNHYWDVESTGIPDSSTFEDKWPKAIFVGSTSGAGQITRLSLEQNLVPRVRLARFARNYAKLDVFLPLILQADAEADALLREEGFGTPTWQWKDQIGYRFIVSMDGNGATCSRVYLALKSNCVLIKYYSENILYYFRGLQDGKHYIGVDRDEELVEILNGDQLVYKSISAESASFAKTYLSRDALEFYTEQLLLRYVEHI